MGKKMKRLQSVLKDERSGKVLFVSHCILNTNARYLGGAFRGCCVKEILDEAVNREIALVQMPCPEQKAWGGILKSYMWLAFEGRKNGTLRLLKLVFPLFMAYTRFIFRRTARSVVKEIIDYENAGYEVTGILGIDGSPTCGVLKAINMKRAFDFYASCSLESLNRAEFNEKLYGLCLGDMSGIYISELKRLLKKNGREINFYSHSLIDEMNGKKTKMQEEKA